MFIEKLKTIEFIPFKDFNEKIKLTKDKDIREVEIMDNYIYTERTEIKYDE